MSKAIITCSNRGCTPTQQHCRKPSTQYRTRDFSVERTLSQIKPGPASLQQHRPPPICSYASYSYLVLHRDGVYVSVHESSCCEIEQLMDAQFSPHPVRAGGYIVVVADLVRELQETLRPSRADSIGERSKSSATIMRAFTPSLALLPFPSNTPHASCRN